MATAAAASFLWSESRGSSLLGGAAACDQCIRRLVSAKTKGERTFEEGDLRIYARKAEAFAATACNHFCYSIVFRHMDLLLIKKNFS